MTRWSPPRDRRSSRRAARTATARARRHAGAVGLRTRHGDDGAGEAARRAGGVCAGVDLRRHLSRRDAPLGDRMTTICSRTPAPAGAFWPVRRPVCMLLELLLFAGSCGKTSTTSACTATRRWTFVERREVEQPRSADASCARQQPETGATKFARRAAPRASLAAASSCEKAPACAACANARNRQQRHQHQHRREPIQRRPPANARRERAASSAAADRALPPAARTKLDVGRRGRRRRRRRGTGCRDAGHAARPPRRRPRARPSPPPPPPTHDVVGGSAAAAGVAPARERAAAPRGAAERGGARRRDRRERAVERAGRRVEPRARARSPSNCATRARSSTGAGAQRGGGGEGAVELARLTTSSTPSARARRASRARWPTPPRAPAGATPRRVRR